MSLTLTLIGRARRRINAHSYSTFSLGRFGKIPEKSNLYSIARIQEIME